jgi:hypothetical protein
MPEPRGALFSFSTAQIEKNWWKKLGKTRLGVKIKGKIQNLLIENSQLYIL